MKLNKIKYLIWLFSSISFSIVLLFVYKYVTSEYEKIVKEQVVFMKETVSKNVSYILAQKNEELIKKVNYIFKNAEITTAMKNKDREKFFSLINPNFQRMKSEDSSLWGIHVIFKDKLSFIRIHKPKSPDTYINYKPLIEECLKNKIPVKGFEVGKYGYFFRVIYPIFSEDKEFLGVAEISSKVDSFSKSLKEQFNYDTAFLIKSKATNDFLKQFDNISETIIVSPTNKELSKDIFNTKGYGIYKKEKNFYSSETIELYDLKNKTKLLMIFKMTDLISSEHNFINNLEFIFGMLIILISIIIYLLVSYFINRMVILDKELAKKDVLIINNSKMVEMGKLIDSIAHQWKQPLSSISSIVTGIRLRKEFNQFDEDSLDEDIDNILTNVKYQAQTIDDFRNYYKTDKLKEDFYLDKVLDLSIKLLGSSLKHNNIELVINADNILIHGLKNELTQSILNIFNNSNDAFSLNGTSENYINISAKKINNSVILYIHDNAGGIPDQYLNYIFENHFTTKKDSGGTGVGLFITKQIIVNNIHGEIEVKNEMISYKDKEYLGTKFSIKIPLS